MTKFLLKDERIRTLKVGGSSDGKHEVLDFLEKWATEAFSEVAKDKGLQVSADTVVMVGSFFPEDFLIQANTWNEEVGSYCEKMLEYLYVDIKGNPEFWKMNPADNFKRYELFRLASLVGNQWHDHSRFLKLGFGTTGALVSDEELAEIQKDPSCCAIFTGSVQ